MLLTSCSTHLPNHDQSGVYAETYCQPDASVLFETGIQGSYRLDDSQPCMNSSMCVIFVSQGIAKIDQETIAKILGDVTLIALNHPSTGGLIGTNHVPVVFGIKLAGELGGVHEVTKHDGKLTAFSFR